MLLLYLVVVDNFNVARAASGPYEADAVLVIDPDAVLAFTVTYQRFEAVARRHCEVTDLVSRVDHQKLLESSIAKFRAVLLDSASVEQLLCVLVGERLDHEPSVPRGVTGAALQTMGEVRRDEPMPPAPYPYPGLPSCGAGFPAGPRTHRE